MRRVYMLERLLMSFRDYLIWNQIIGINVTQRCYSFFLSILYILCDDRLEIICNFGDSVATVIDEITD